MPSMILTDRLPGTISSRPIYRRLPPPPQTVDECRRLAVELPRLAGQLPSATVFLARCSAVAPKFDPIALPALVAYQ